MSGDAPAVPLDFSHQTDIFDPNQFGWPVHLIGAGGIGSALALPTMKIGVRELHLWDTDRVEAHNVPNQMLFRHTDIGKFKVDAAKEMLEMFGFDVEIVVHNEWVTEDTALEGVVISGVDSIQSRQAIWQAVKRNAFDIPFYMDARVGGEFLRLLTANPMDPDDVDFYEPYLDIDPDTIPELPCAARAVIHPVGTVANWAVSALTHFYREIPVPNVQTMEMVSHYYDFHFRPQGD